MGKANKRLTYVDQVLQLVYEDGSPCPSKSGLTYKSVISFVCRPEAGPTNRPMLISLDKQTCTLFFSWHTPLACEQVVSRAGPMWPLRNASLMPGGLHSPGGPWFAHQLSCSYCPPLLPPEGTRHGLATRGGPNSGSV